MNYFSLAISIMVMTSLAALPARAQTILQDSIAIEEGGKLWIEGSTSVSDYRCHAENLSRNAKIEIGSHSEQQAEKPKGLSLYVTVLVKALECGKRAMNNDMFEALKADTNPALHYHLLDAVPVEESHASREGGTAWTDIFTTGVLEIAGVRDTIRAIVHAMPLGNDRFRAKGSKELRMDTFDIEPPRALFGLIKASKNLTLHFDVTVRLNKEETVGFSYSSSRWWVRKPGTTKLNIR